MWNDDPRVKSGKLSKLSMHVLLVIPQVAYLRIYRLDLFGFKTSWCSKQKKLTWFLLVLPGLAATAGQMSPEVSTAGHHLTWTSSLTTRQRASCLKSWTTPVCFLTSWTRVSSPTSRTSKSKASSARSEAKKNLTATCSSPLDQLASNPADTADTAATTASARDLIAIWWIRVNFAGQCSPSMLSAAD